MMKTVRTLYKNETKLKWQNNNTEEDRNEYVKIKKECEKQIKGTERGRTDDEIEEIELENKNENTKIQRNETIRPKILSGHQKLKL